jgi:CRISPR-associated protein Csc3
VTVSETLKNMAEIAWQHRVKGASLKRNALIYPISVFFDKLRKNQGKANIDFELIRVSAIQEVTDHIERTTEDKYKLGKVKREAQELATEQIANLFFYNLVKDSFGGKVHQAISEEKTIKSAYLFYMRNQISKKEENDDNS